MDGNGRWAKNKFLPRNMGHKKGAEVFQDIADYCDELGLESVTFYAFSTENWSRPQEEINGLMNLLEKTLDKYMREAKTNNLRILISGRREPLPPHLLAKIDQLTAETAHKTGLTVVLALNYGSRAELLDAVQKLVQDGIKNPTQADLQARLYQPAVPDPELLIRTSGEKRLSNFLLWQCAYTEFYFTDTLWPDFAEKDLSAAVEDFSRRTRRFGGL